MLHHNMKIVFFVNRTWDIPCTSVFESEELIAFLDISPVNKGHTLLVPKAHMERCSICPLV